MQIISHRGCWKNISEKNQKKAFINSFDLNLGTETDLRDICGKIVISHDMPKGNEMNFEELLQIMNGRNLLLALNIKADGQGKAIFDLLKKYNHTNYFTFDMSIPDMVSQIKLGLNVFSGISDLLKKPVLLDKSNGIWLDNFNSDWYNEELIDNFIDIGKKVSIVSSDLHNRDVEYQWNIIKKTKNIKNDNLILCTDKPMLAKEFFEV